MKLHTQTREVATNLASSTSMQIQNTAHMFDLLSDKLYSDKPKAVIREIACNALDASTRFLISLPSAIEPMLSVRDYGPGMDHDFMLAGYTWVGHSTKNQDNTQVGGFGIGRMAPLAYTDAYTVTTFQAGVQRVYAVYRDSERIPQVSLVEETATDEPDGTEVKVPVRASDFNTFVQKAQEILQWFPEGSYETFGFDVDPPKILTSHPRWLTIPAGPYSRHKVRMGPVVYDVDWSLLDIELPKSIMVLFDVGDLSLAPSREHLSYDKTTLAKLKERFEEIAQDYPARVLREAMSMTPFERLALVKELQTSGFRSIFDAYHKMRGNRARDKLLTKQRLKPKWGDYLLYEHERHTIRTPYAHYQRARRGYHLERTPGMRPDLELTAGSYETFLRRTIVFHDLTEERGPKIHARLNEHYSDAHLFYPSKDVPDAGSLQALLPASMIVRRLSELDPPRTERASYKVKLWRHVPGTDYLNETDAEVEDESLYVPFKGGDAEPGFDQRFVKVPWAIHSEWFGLSIKARQQLDMNALVRLDDWIMSKAEEALADPNTAVALSADWVLQQAANSEMWSAFSHPNLFPAIWEKIKTLREINRSAVPSLRHLANMEKIKLPKPRDHLGLLRLMERAQKRNPVLQYFINVDRRREGLRFDNPVIQNIVR